MTREEAEEVAGWTYTEQCLHQLDDFTDSDGFRITWHDMPSVGATVWKIEQSRQQRRGPAAWLAQVSGGYAWSPAGARDARNARSDRCYADAGQALEAAKQHIRAQDAAARLGAPG